MPADREPARVSAVPPGEVLSVSALVRSVRDLLEHRYPLLWVGGEISNFMVAASGHAYFVLKDARAQVRCVMFRQRLQGIGWKPRDGERVELRALPGLYEARGEFQLTVETMRRSGLGALFEAFVRLRDKLEQAGLFDTALKRELPRFPGTIGVVTSVQAAALHDVLTTLARRNPALRVIVYPAPVQGEGAQDRIAAALGTAGRRRECDVLLLCRGGGTIEDLWAFNSELVARAIRACPVPVVTGIGHEIDFTIADFAADRRAPTPTAAAELVSPDRAALLSEVARLVRAVSRCAQRHVAERAQQLDHVSRRLVHPQARLSARSELLAQLVRRLQLAAGRAIEDRRGSMLDLVRRAGARRPRIADLGTRPQQLLLRLEQATHAFLERAAARCAGAATGLAHLDPASVLQRGYSIVQTASGAIVADSAAVSQGESVRIRFARGQASARIEDKS